MAWTPKVLVDFDGVIHAYTRGWADGTCYDPPVHGAKEALAVLEQRGYEVVVFSTREEGIPEWLEKWEFPAYRVTNVKEPSVALIDDRAIRFLNWDQVRRELFNRYPLKHGKAEV